MMAIALMFVSLYYYAKCFQIYDTVIKVFIFDIQSAERLLKGYNRKYIYFHR